MTVHVEAPLRYKHWSGATRELPGDDLRDGWPCPVMIDHHHHGWIVTLPDMVETPWVHLGWAPRARSRWGRFWAHYHHGRLMHYPRLSVLAFCVRGLFFPPSRWWSR